MMISRLLPRTRDDCHCPTARRSEFVVLLRMRPCASLSSTRPSLSPIVLVVVTVARRDMKLRALAHEALSSTFDVFIPVVVTRRTILE